MIKNLFPPYFVFLICCLAALSCKRERPHVNLDDIPDNLKISRFEQELFNIESKRVKEADAAFLQRYPEFYPVYCIRMMGFGAPGDSQTHAMIKRFITHPSLIDLKRVCDSVYGADPEQFADLREAFRYFKYYFPDKPVPEVVTMISEFGFATAYMDSTLALGLDMYLGSDYKYYTGVGFPTYLIKNMTPDYLVPQAIQAWGRAVFEREKAGQRFLDKMINEGKVWYMSAMLCPDLPDSLLTGLSTEQLKWCDDNQYQMWTHFIEQKLLFETDRTIYSAYVSEGPFTIASGVPPESAPLIGKYAGWQIVKRYMQKNKNVSLQALMENYNADEILSKSGYRP